MVLRSALLSLSLLAVGCGAKDKRPADGREPSSAASALGNVDAKGIIFVGGTPQDLQRQPLVKFGKIAPAPPPAPRPQ